MLTRILENRWFRQLAVAAGYAVGYALLRQISFSHWVLFAGLRLGALMLLPYRYWPALLVGELVPLGYLGLSCLDQFGWAWSAAMFVPPIGLAMPIVRFCREQRRLFPTRSINSINVLLLCSLLVSVVWALADTVALVLATQHTPYDYRAAAGRYFLGCYIGILTVVPLVLAVREEVASKPPRQVLASMIEAKGSEFPKIGDGKAIGFVGGRDIPVIRNFLGGYEQGAKYAAPDVKVNSVFGNFSWRYLPTSGR